MKQRGIKQRISILLLTFAIILSGLNFIGTNKVSAATDYPYLIKVNKQQNCVTVYGKDEKGKYTVPVKAMICSVGNDTPIGSFRTPAKYRWRLLMNDVWGQYSTRIKGGILFHSVWYYKQDPSTLSARQYNKLGTTASHGCVRLTVEDAKWIYDNCPVGTTVTIYNAKDPGPLGKPEAIKLPSNAVWDPTDVTNNKNPYNNKKPSINGVKNLILTYGQTYDPKKGVTAKSTTGMDITSKLTIKSKVNTKKPGKYKVTYTVKDQIDRDVKKTITVTVKEDNSLPTIKGVKDFVVGPKTKVDRNFVLKNVTAFHHGASIPKSKIEVSINKVNSTKYNVVYRVTGSNDRTAVQKCNILIDNKSPVFKGIRDKEIAWDTKVTTKMTLEGVSVSDNYSKMFTKDITITIKKNDNDTYTVTYKTKDGVGNVVLASATYTITNFLRFEGIADEYVEYDFVPTEEMLREKVKAYDKDEDISDKMEIKISDKVDNQYTVIYIIKDDNGHDRVATEIYTLDEEPVVEEEIE